MDFAALEVGKTYDGAIVSVTDFGAFVNIGCQVDGLLHISQISKEFVKNVADAVSIGQAISVRVLNVDTDRKKFSVSAIPEGQEHTPSRSDEYTPSDGADGDRRERPRQARAQRSNNKAPRAPIPVSAGDVITGKIASVAPFGVFVEVGEGYSGMLHATQMKLPEGVADHVGHFKEGDEVEVRVVSVQKGQRISLTQKSEEEMAAEEETRTKGLASSGM